MKDFKKNLDAFKKANQNDEIADLVYQIYSNKSETNQLFYISISFEQAYNLLKKIKASEKLTIEKLKEIYTKRENTNEISDLELLGLASELGLDKINNKLIKNATKSEIRDYIFKNYDKYEPEASKLGIKKENIKSSDKLLLNAPKFLKHSRI